MKGGKHRLDVTYRGNGDALSSALSGSNSRLARIVLVAVLSTGCSVLVNETPVETLPGSTTPSTSVASSTTTTSGRTECIDPSGATTPVDTGDISTDAITLSTENFRCSREVVVVAQGILSEAVAAAQLAAALDAPLLMPHAQLAAELGRLRPERVHVVGNAEVDPPANAELVRHDIGGAVEAAGDLMGVSAEPPVDEFSAVSETVIAIENEEAVILPNWENTLTSPPDRLVTDLARETDGRPVWLVDAADPLTVLLASVAGKAADAAVVPVDVNDLFLYPEVGMSIAGYPDRAIRQVGFSSALDDWKLRTLARGQQLPGGGFELFPDHINRRFVGFYGNPASPALGAMGQVSPEQALALMSDGGTLTGYLDTGCLPSPCQGTVQPGLLDGFAADGAHVVPMFNYIGSVAQPSCGTHLFPIEDFQAGIDVAGESGGYVVFDLQPGSEDFLSHAQFYEDVLRLPHVSVGIDPEWRCAWPGQTDFDRRGTVTAAEINLVIEWLADLVNSEGLPQKLLVIQQFREDMIQDRDQLASRPEVQVVIQMDGEGQGNLSNKDGTWNNITAGTEDNHWLWGWKNFFVRDHPEGPYTPEQTLTRTPIPVYITYQ